MFQQLDGWVFSPEERRSFAPLFPDSVAELASPNDEEPRGLYVFRRNLLTINAIAPDWCGFFPDRARRDLFFPRCVIRD